MNQPHPMINDCLVSEVAWPNAKAKREREWINGNFIFLL